jgi:hypothetical protein
MRDRWSANTCIFCGNFFICEKSHRVWRELRSKYPPLPMVPQIIIDDKNRILARCEVDPNLDKRLDGMELLFENCTIRTGVI